MSDRISDEKRVFVSSTQADLEFERQVTVDVLRTLKLESVNMENWGADLREPIKVCQAKLQASHAMVLIIGSRYGSLWADSGKSYTEAEYDYAIANQIPVYVYLKDEAYSPPAVNSDDLQRLRAFRTAVKSGRTTSKFTNHVQLRERLDGNMSGHFGLSHPVAPPKPATVLRPHFIAFVSEDGFDKRVTAVRRDRIQLDQDCTLAGLDTAVRQEVSPEAARAWVQARDDLGRAIRELFLMGREAWEERNVREYIPLVAESLKLSMGALDALANLVAKLEDDPLCHQVAVQLARVPDFARIALAGLTAREPPFPTTPDLAMRLAYQIVDWLFQGLRYADGVLHRVQYTRTLR